ncbi:glycosyl hydrolase [Lacrimispora sp. 38-1]|uniref:glycosyl hydrolase n=1 Tax=Lacrimispora sp. 38-1 TaxID=3125778 RepID=UPI003CE91F9C
MIEHYEKYPNTSGFCTCGPKFAGYEKGMVIKMKKEEFKKPVLRYRMRTIIHNWPEDIGLLAEAVKAYGYGGTATNPPTENGYTGNKENIVNFAKILDQLKKKNLDYWIYDEKGYPSGYAGGLTLKDHPELEAKGFYMHRRIAYEPRHTQFVLDDESDKIIWAAKYPIDCAQINSSIIQYDRMEPVPFTKTHCSCDLATNEVFVVFCVKSAYEGSHLTHNVCSYNRYINILDHKAVERFLEVCYEPIVKDIPDAYRNAEAVFTDEPSLQVGYLHGDETWPYALAPWVDGLFETFEDKYGYSLLPYLPMIFEGRSNAYQVRIDFYELIGELVADAYVRQISEWCKAHGGRFSGHYLAEESMQAHVIYYGNYLKVLQATDYPGVDVLASYPEIYNYNTVKFAQMAARKNDTNGLMTELCPFIDRKHFNEKPLAYARGIINLLYMGGCRCINSYFAPDFSAFAPDKLHAYHGYLKQEEANQLNEYVGRLGYLLDQTKEISHTFVYYAIEDVQAKTLPSHSAILAESSATDRSLTEITRLIYENGFDYLFADAIDLVQAANSLKSGKPVISGIVVKSVILPTMDIIRSEVMDSLQKLQRAGVQVLFVDQIPKYLTGTTIPFAYYDFREESLLDTRCKENEYFKSCKAEDVLKQLEEQEEELELSVIGKDTALLKSRLEKDDQIIYFLVNNTPDEVEVKWYTEQQQSVTLWNPEDGTSRKLQEGELILIQAYRGVFLMWTK